MKELRDENSRLTWDVGERKAVKKKEFTGIPGRSI